LGSALEESKKSLRSSRNLGSAFEASKKSSSRSSRNLGSALEESKKLSRSSRNLGSALEESKKLSRSSRTFGSALGESKRLSRSSRTLGSALDEYDAAASSPKPKSAKSLAFRSGEKSRSSRKSLASSRSTEHEGSIDGKPKASRTLSPKEASRKVSKSKSLRSMASKSSEKSSSSKTRSETSSELTSLDPADEETVEIQFFDENGTTAVEVEGGGKRSLQILHGILGDILKGGAPVDDEDEMSEMISAEGASPARPSPRRKIKFMPTPSSDGDTYSDILSTADKSMPSLTDLSMEDFSMGPPQKTVPINYSTFSGLKKGMDKPAPKKKLTSPVGKSRVNKSPDNKNPAPVSDSWRALRGSVDFIRETKKKARVTRNQRRTIVEDNPRDDDDIDSTSSPFIGDIHLPTALTQLGSAGIQPHIEVVDGKTRLVFELTSEESSMDLEKKLAQTLLSARV
jgi:hypothetical protein